METLKELDAVAYVRFASVYRNFREAKDFEDFLGATRANPHRRRDGRSVTHARRPGAGAAGPGQLPGPTPRSAASWSRTAACSAAPSPPPAAARMPSRWRWRWPGPAARGATVYVTLEPCCHHGRTPPCTDALIAAGVARVVVATRDPDPRVNGAGPRPAARGRDRGGGGAAGEPRPRRSMPASSPASRLGRPLVTLKLAATLDGRIATHDGREPLDHRRRGAARGARAARAQRRGPGRRRHGADRRSRPDLPPPRLPRRPR